MLVNEIFDSFQGEGIYVGGRATFLRLSGCNLTCSFCDTNSTRNINLSVSDVAEKIKENMKKNNVPLLVVTGGEPLLQYDEVEQLITQLNCKVQIETNGTIMKKPLSATYMISPKTNIKKIYNFYKKYDNTHFKFIIQDKSDLDLLNKIVDDDKTVYLQPEYSNAQILTQLILDTSLNFNYKISGQLHKYLGVD